MSRLVSELVGLVPLLSQPDSESAVASRGLERLIAQTPGHEWHLRWPQRQRTEQYRRLGR